MDDEGTSTYKKIYSMVRQIPRGRVATYGQIASLVGGCSARMVGYAMAGISDATIPWQRVINARGRISIRDPNGYSLQKAILEREGVVFDESDTIDLEVFGWQP
ncbi:cysteine methyltransferase [Mesotoga sp. Brook.08.YT.4.2.5.1]|uniref:MGMT family protein n=1 Tax=unclassified Mesotoga TaxID=1184398 RepID=UPI000C9B418E|nr:MULTISPECIES: MGMT family protein [unclassified Mesotoga]PNE20291.1 cysteine methyltransferase [Mesotoga sp. Brook.08.YT.4.2.5.1]RAO96201.1 hypothetical protein M388_14760 [Mesotoga sp. Brook.08.YT.4.2.5.4.]RDI93556.1 cysteine methyltransferase [Mesotoga sp. Brook.08.YT.4.2.5.2.]